LHFDHPLNKIRVPGHIGPHGIFNDVVFERLEEVSVGKVGVLLHDAVVNELKSLRYRVRAGDLRDLLTARASQIEVNTYK